MILWMIKLISSVRKAIAGRKHPGQLAWGVALGALLGMIPHGNLLAVGLLLFVLLLQVNHAMVALVGVVVTFLAPRLDPTFDAVGRWVFAQPQVADRLSLAWQYPLVPWTDLNNTIVMGSLLIGLATVGPLYLISYPLFRAWAPIDDKPEESISDSDSSKAESDPAAEVKSSIDEISNPERRFDDSHDNHEVNRPNWSDKSDVIATSTDASEVVETTVQVPHPNPAAETNQLPAKATETQAASRTTRVAIGTSQSGPVLRPTRTKTSRTSQSKTTAGPHGSAVDEQHKIDEALSYLLRQLRDSKDKDVA